MEPKTCHFIFLKNKQTKIKPSRRKKCKILENVIMRKIYKVLNLLRYEETYMKAGRGSLFFHSLLLYFGGVFNLKKQKQIIKLPVRSPELDICQTIRRVQDREQIHFNIQKLWTKVQKLCCRFLEKRKKCFLTFLL